MVESIKEFFFFVIHFSLDNTAKLGHMKSLFINLPHGSVSCQAQCVVLTSKSSCVCSWGWRHLRRGLSWSLGWILYWQLLAWDGYNSWGWLNLSPPPPSLPPSFPPSPWLVLVTSRHWGFKAIGFWESVDFFRGTLHNTVAEAVRYSRSSLLQYPDKTQAHSDSIVLRNQVPLWMKEKVFV